MVSLLLQCIWKVCAVPFPQLLVRRDWQDRRDSDVREVTQEWLSRYQGGQVNTGRTKTDLELILCKVAF